MAFMKKPTRRIVAIFATASAAVLALAFSACSVTINDNPSGDGGLDATSGDPLADTLTCTGVEPVCIQSYCNDVKSLDVDYSPICTAEGWKCRAGQMPMSECRCGLPPRRDCLFPDAGADASLGDADASQADASADATID